MAEQQWIVQELDQRLSNINELETLTDAQILRCDRLCQSILKNAFAGKLVPQNNNDESVENSFTNKMCTHFFA